LDWLTGLHPPYLSARPKPWFSTEYFVSILNNLLLELNWFFSPHLTHLFYHNKIFVTINTNKRPTLFGHCVYWEMYVISMNSTMQTLVCRHQ
jgi:hypothetical protein